MKRIVTQELLLEVLNYDPETGFLTWKPRGLHLFKSEREMKIFNTSHAGKQALTTIDGGGYPHGTLFRQSVYAHRVIWQMVHDEKPELVDHINRDRGDNRLANLRAANKSLNALNSDRSDRAAMRRAA